MITLTERIDPLIERLLKQGRKIDWNHDLRLILYLCVAASGSLLLLALVARFSDSAVTAFALGIGAIMALVPSLFGIPAASITVRDISSEAFDLLKISNVSSRELIWSYVLAALYRRKILLYAVVSLMPIAAVLLGFSIILGSNFNTGCITSPLGISYCHGSSGDTESTTVLIVGLLQLVIAGLGSALSILSMIVLATAIGVSSAFQWKSQPAALTSTLVSSLVCGIFTVIVTVPELVFCAALNVYPPHIIAMIAYAVVFGFAPYLLSIFLSHWAMP